MRVGIVGVGRMGRAIARKLMEVAGSMGFDCKDVSWLVKAYEKLFGVEVHE